MAYTPLEIQGSKLDLEGDYRAETPFLEGVKKSIGLGYDETPVGSLIQAYTLREYQSGKMLQPQELNKMYPFLDIPFAEPEDSGVALTMANRYIDKMNTQKEIAEGPKSNLYSIATFAGQMLPHALDPLNVAGGMGVTALVGKMAFAANITKAANAVGASKGAIAAKYALEGADMFVGNLPGELVGQMANVKQHQEGSFENVLFNSVIGAGFGLGIKGVVHGVSKFLHSKGPKLENITLSTALAQADQGITPNTNAIVKAAVQETGHDYGFGHTPLTTTPDVPTSGKFFVAADSPHGGLDGKILTPGQVEIGEGMIHLTDNPHVANGEAGSNFRESEGSVVQVDLKDANLYNLENLKEDIGVTKKEFLEMGVDKRAEILDELKMRGHDGIHYVVNDLAGEAHSPHNAIVLFNKDKLTQGESFQAESSRVKSLSQAEAEQIYTDSAKNKLGQEKFSESDLPVRKETKKLAEIDEFKQVDARFEEEIASLDKNGDLPLDMKKELAEIKLEATRMENEHNAMKEYLECVLGVVGGD